MAFERWRFHGGTGDFTAVERRGHYFMRRGDFAGIETLYLLGGQSDTRASPPSLRRTAHALGATHRCSAATRPRADGRRGSLLSPEDHELGRLDRRDPDHTDESALVDVVLRHRADLTPECLRGGRRPADGHDVRMDRRCVRGDGSTRLRSHLVAHRASHPPSTGSTIP